MTDLSLLLLGRVVYAAILALLGISLITLSWRHDRFLGAVVAIAVVVYMTGGLAFGWYLQSVHGRDYFAPDERAFQLDAQGIVEGWRTGRAYVSTISDGWPHVNAVVLALWGGPSLVPMRFLNALASAATIAAVYLLAVITLAGRVEVARTAACFVFLSPSLCVFAFTDLKERMLGLFVVLALVAIVALVRRRTWVSWLGLMVALLLLGELRHYYAALLGWLSIVAFTVFGRPPWRRWASDGAVLVASVGFVLLAVTGTFLGTSMFQETVVRYVPDESTVSETARHSDYSTLGETSGHGERLNMRNPRDVLRSLRFVVFGRFSSRGEAGRTMALATAPEWFINFALVPLALWAGILALRQPNRLLLVSCTFVGGMILLLAITHGDDWSTFRFRAIYWPVYLMIGAAGAVQVYQSVTSSVRAGTSSENVGSVLPLAPRRGDSRFSGL